MYKSITVNVSKASTRFEFFVEWFACIFVLALF